MLCSRTHRKIHFNDITCDKLLAADMGNKQLRHRKPQNHPEPTHTSKQLRCTRPHGNRITACRGETKAPRRTIAPRRKQKRVVRTYSAQFSQEQRSLVSWNCRKRSYGQKDARFLWDRLFNVKDRDRRLVSAVITELVGLGILNIIGLYSITDKLRLIIRSISVV